jgi:hypothetical protein
MSKHTTFRDLALPQLLGKTKSYKNRRRWAHSVQLTTVPTISNLQTQQRMSHNICLCIMMDAPECCMFLNESRNYPIFYSPHSSFIDRILFILCVYVFHWNLDYISIYWRGLGWEVGSQLLVTSVVQL